MQRISGWTFVAALALVGMSAPCWAWGDEGHMIIAAVAQRFFDPTVRDQVGDLLKDDNDDLTAGDLASRATWADKYRDSDRNTTKQRYEATEQWHFVDIELDGPNVDSACFGHPPVPPQTPASKGPKDDCVLDKINQFKAELSNPATPEPEKLLALKFMLHFVGDVHQPLHAADDHDRGGNDKFVIFANRTTCMVLHAYWDTTLVRRLGRNFDQIARDLVNQFGAQTNTWMSGQPTDWALESFGLARDVAYKLPPTIPDERGHRCSELTPQYEDQALATAREQLAKAGIRLAAILNQALRR
jgi:S1/P1 Nuclease